jgi:hypothetical protein
MELFLLALGVVLLIMLVRRARPSHQRGLGPFYRCPHCRAKIDHRSTHCPYCTQATGWELKKRIFIIIVALLLSGCASA